MPVDIVQAESFLPYHAFKEPNIKNSPFEKDCKIRKISRTIKEISEKIPTSGDFFNKLCTRNYKLLYLCLLLSPDLFFMLSELTEQYIRRF
jgi:hypothetical protein